MNKKRYLVRLLSLCLAVTLLNFGAMYASAAVWTGGTAVPAIEDNVYVIDTPEKLAWFSNYVNSGNNTIKGRITADLQMNSNGSTTNEWTPIGTAEHPFLGEFNGGGYSISNLYIDNGTSDNQGLFGYTGRTLTNEGYDVETEDPIYSPAIIMYVTLTGANIKGKTSVGGVVGYSLGSSVSGCSVSGTIQGTANNVGGIVGNNRVAASVTDCLNESNVSGASRIGGIVGYNYSNAIINGCCNKGNVSSSASFAGGIVGTSSGSEVTYSYNVGNITATVNQAGGLIGYVAFGEIKRNYTLGTVTCPGDYVGAVFGNVYYGSDIYKCYFNRDENALSDVNAVAAEQILMLDMKFIESINASDGKFVKDYFIVNGGYPLLRWQLTAWDGSVSRPNTDSNGRYLISTGNELAWFAGLTNGTISGVMRNSDADAVVTKDILLNLDYFDANSKEWAPIGNGSYPYTGTFDGGGHKISGIYTKTQSTDGTSSYVGLFGYVGTGGIVRNIYTEDSQIKGYKYVGIIAGYNEGTISNCFNFTKVEGVYYVGSIAGANYGTISNCGNFGYICATIEDSGGIVGYNAVSASVSGCYNAGNVEGKKSVGGIVGMNLYNVSNCYNTGDVYALIDGTTFNGGEIGGLIGTQQSGTLSCLYARGSVSCPNNQKGAAIGKMTDGTINYCYYNSDEANVTDNYATPRTTSEMTVAQTLWASCPGFSSTYWVVRASNVYFDYYPELKAFYSSTDNKVAVASEKSAVSLKPEYNVMDEVDGEMTSYYITVADAIEHIGVGEGSAILIDNCEAVDTAAVTGNVTLTTDGNAWSLTRASAASGISLFNVTGVKGILTINTAGTDESPLLTIDGGSGNELTGLSVISVEAPGVLNLYPGVVIQNNSSTQNGGAVNCGGTFNMYGGSITANSTTGDGGAIYIYDDGIFNAEKGVIFSNTATLNGGGICNAGGTVALNRENENNNIPGNTPTYEVFVSGNHAVNGGGIYNSADGTATISGNAVAISGNNSTNGGGIYNLGTFSVLTGYFSGNTATSNGSAIYENGTLQVGGSLYLAGSNSIYLPAGKTVENIDTITKSGIVAKIVSENYSVGTQVLSGDFCAKNYAHFEMVAQNSTMLYINSTGYLIDTAATEVAELSVFGLYSVRYTSLKEAVDAINDIAQSPEYESKVGVIKMIDNSLITEKITVSGRIRIIGDGNATRTLTRYHTCSGDMFEVLPGASLEFGIDGEASNTDLIIDGSYNLSGLEGGSVVRNRGDFIMSDGVTVTGNCSTTNGGVVYSEENVSITGGVITSSVAVNGGAIYIADGTISITGGTITENNADCGGAVYSLAESYTDEDSNVVPGFVMQGGTISDNEADNGGAITVDGGSFGFEGGNVTENTASANGGAIYVINNGIANVTTGVITVSEEDPDTGDIVYNNENVYSHIMSNTAVNGGGVYIASGSAEVDGGTLRYNSSTSGGAMYIASGASASLFDDSVISTNTATFEGAGIYAEGIINMNSDAFVNVDNEVYLATENAMNIASAYTEGESTVALLDIFSYAIGRMAMTGEYLNTVNSRVTMVQRHFFVTMDGTLDTDEITLSSESVMGIDYDTKVIVGMNSDVSSNTVASLLVNFDNTNAGLAIRDENGNTLSDDDIIYTGCTIVLTKNGIDTLDSITIAFVGDANGDGKVDGQDAVLASYAAASDWPLVPDPVNHPERLNAAYQFNDKVNPAVARACDANNDGVTDLNDVRLLRDCGLLQATVSQPSSSVIVID